MNFILRWQKLLILLLVFGATVVGVSIEGYPTGGVVTGQTYTITYSPGGSTVSRHPFTCGEFRITFPRRLLRSSCAKGLPPILAPLQL